MLIFKKKPKTYPYLGLIHKKKPKTSRLHRLANWLDAWHITRIMSSLGSFALIITLAMLWEDYTERYEQRTNQAWSLLNDKASGNSGKKEAMQYLNKEVRYFKKRQPLEGIDLSTGVNPGVYLQGVQLSNANLDRAIMPKANLKNANLSEVSLVKANLREADLTGAVLLKAKLYMTDLTGANLERTDLRGVNLRSTINLSQEALDYSCGDRETVAPKDLHIALCFLDEKGNIDWYETNYDEEKEWPLDLIR